MSNDDVKQNVYLITDVTDSKVYAGDSVELPKRMRSHQNALRAESHSNWRLQRAFDKGHELIAVALQVPVDEDVRVIEQKNYPMNSYQPGSC